MTTILHVYKPGLRELEQIETLHAVIQLAFHCGANDGWDRVTERTWDFFSIPTVADSDWLNVIVKCWYNYDDFISFDQDIVPSIQMVQDLVLCPEPLCCFPYRLKDGRWSVWEVGNPLEGEDYKNGSYYQLFYEKLPVFAEGSGFGLVKIAEEIRNKIDWNDYPIDRFKWWYLDCWLSRQIYLLDERWHVHTPPVKHNRRLYDENNRLLAFGST